MLTAAGVLTIAASSELLALAVLYFVFFLFVLNTPYSLLSVILGSFALVGFGSGLASGILTLKRMSFLLVIAGLGFMIVCSTLAILTWFLSPIYLVIGLLTLPPCTLAIIFGSLRRYEFR